MIRGTMLQPAQLSEVASRHSGEIAELRSFLRAAGCSADAPPSLAEVAVKLQSDRTFHRDLTSYLWIVVEQGNGDVSPSDLLAILAIATAGEQLAATADEDVAHRLLRFILEARRSFETASNALLPRTVGSDTSANEALRADPQNGTVPRTAAERRQLRPFVGWAIAAACLLVLCVGGAWLHHRNRSVQTAPDNAQLAGQAPGEQPTVQGSGNSSLPSGAPEPEGMTELPTGRTEKRVLPATRSTGAGAVTSIAPPAARSAPPLETESVATTAVLMPPVSNGSLDNPPAASAFSRPRSSKTPAPPIPADTLSKRLGARTLPQSSAIDAGLPPNHPHLLRRRPFVAADTVGDDQIAELRPTDRPPAQSGSPANRSPAAVHGTVHLTTLGLMAANILYSPAPAYPAAASAAHVQGQVTVQAAVDRDGNVAYARVVSGPPLLRDAAVDAVQHWRYKPYLAGGKPAAATATALLEFELY